MLHLQNLLLHVILSVRKVKLTMDTVIEAPRWINEKQTSKITGMALQTLRNWRFKGVGPPYSKVGRAVRYRLDEIVAFMERKKVSVEGK